ncbi:hypothetical protein GCM10023066_28980 [Nocardioides kongjuensis]
MTTFESLQEEHAPQQSGASLLGSDRCVVLTCSACNGGANLTYEMQAASPETSTTHASPLGCPTHGLVLDHSRGDLILIADELPLVLTDLKSAFLVAFATLGYGWSTTAGLRPVRTAIQSGTLPPNGTCSIVKLRDHDGQNIVMQLSGPSRSILVQAASGIAVQLPCPGSASLPILDGLAVRTRQWSWPTLNGSHKQLEVARRAGNLFHTDFCDGHSW